MLELLELGELAAEQMDAEMIQNQIEDMMGDYNEALAGGFEDIANTYKEKIEELKSKLGYHQGKTETIEGTEETTHQGRLGEHQGKTLEEISEEADYLKGKLYVDSSGTIIETTGGEARSGEISFGSSDIKTLETRADKWLNDVEFHEGQLETSVKQGKDTSKNMSDLKSAKRQYELAVKELEWARKHP